MGQTEINSALTNVSKLSLQCFNILETIGKGGYSLVYRAEFIKTGHIVAIKKMSKMKLSLKQMTKNIIKEKDILSSLYHPFIVNMYATFQDHDSVYIVMDYCSCCDFHYQLQYIKIITEEQIKFFAGCVILGLEYIHSQGIIHRDLKPENLICDNKGFLKISDFGVAKRINDIEPHLPGVYEIYGTPGFIAPEIVSGNCDNIGYECDYYSLGVILYEIITGNKPYISQSKHELINEYTKHKVILTKKECNDIFSEELCDFISKLIEVDHYKRIGRNGIDELKSHPFFSGFNWKQLFYKTIKVPWIPKYIRHRKVLLTQQYVNKLRQKATISKDSNDTNDSEESNHFQEFNDFDFIRTPKINYLTTFYNNKLIHSTSHSNVYSNNSNSISNNNNSYNNIYRSNNSIKKTISIVSPKKDIYKLSPNKNSSCSNIQFYQNIQLNDSLGRRQQRSSSLTKLNKCNLPLIMNNSNNNKLLSEKKQLFLLSSVRKHKGSSKLLGNKDSISSFEFKDKQCSSTINNNHKTILFKKIGKRNSFGYNNKNNFNLSAILKCKIE